MKIAIISKSENGGAGIAAKRHKVLLESLNFDVTLISHKNLNVFQKNLQRLLNKFSRIILNCFFPSNFMTSLDIHSFVNWKKKLKNFNFIFIHWTNDNFLVPSDLLYLNKQSYVFLYMHDEWYSRSIFHYKSDEKYFSFFEKILLKYKKYKLNIYKNCITGIISPTEYLLNLLPNEFNNKFLIENPIDQEWIKIKSEIKFDDKKNYDIIFFASNAEEDYRKGYHYFLEVLKYLDNPRLSIGIIGSHDKKTNNNIEYLGELNALEIYSVLTRSKLLLHTSLADNYPNVILEALYFETEIVAFDVGGISEVLVNKDNLIVPFNTYLMAQKAEQLLLTNYKNDYHQKIMKRNWLKLQEKYSNLLKQEW